METSKFVALLLIGGGILLFILGLLADMDVIPKFSQWEGIPLNIIGAILILGGIVFAVLLGIGKSGIKVLPI
jgi:hypothetical protein